MTASDERRMRMAAILAQFAELWDKQLTESLLNIYIAALEDLAIEDIEDAARDALRDSSYFPKPVDLRRLVGATDQDGAEQAWGALQNLVRTTGLYGSPKWGEAFLTKRVVTLLYGSWGALCQRLPNANAGRTYETAKQEFTAAWLAELRAQRNYDRELAERAQRPQVTEGSDERQAD